MSRVHSDAVGVSVPTELEADGRSLCDERVMGMVVAGYRWKQPVLDGWAWSYASHWSTPGEHRQAERLFAEPDVRIICEQRAELLEAAVELLAESDELDEAAMPAEYARLREAVRAASDTAANKLAGYEGEAGVNPTPATIQEER